jgi:hypothetical protein
MAALIQPIVDLIGLMAAALAITMTPLLIAGMLMRQLRWFGFDAFEKEVEK